MFCCEECFSDNVLKAVIRTKGRIERCDFCGSESVRVYQLDEEEKELQNLLSSVLSLYDPSEEGSSLSAELSRHWHIINSEKLGEKTTYDLLSAMYADPKEDYAAFVRLFQSDSVRLKRETQYDWNAFANELMYRNRFFASSVDLEELLTLLSYAARSYERGTRFYRARIANDENGFACCEMGAPPSGRTGGGRINPPGISELYLADDEDTALHEIRAGMHDYVSFGEFELTRDATVVDFSRIGAVSPFELEDKDLETYAMNLDVLDGMKKEIAKPMRSSDNPLEYIPSQFISELIKAGINDAWHFDGVAYKSTLKPGGKNICLFDESVCSCVGVYTERVTGVHYDKG